MSPCRSVTSHPRTASNANPIYSGIAFLIDLHAHAAKRGCFLYGNRLISTRLQAEVLLYARLTSANSAFMDFDACCFSQRNMTVKEKRDENLSKEGCARVGIHGPPSPTQSLEIFVSPGSVGNMKFYLVRFGPRFHFFAGLLRDRSVMVRGSLYQSRILLFDGITTHIHTRVQL